MSRPISTNKKTSISTYQSVNIGSHVEGSWDVPNTPTYEIKKMKMISFDIKNRITKIKLTKTTTSLFATVPIKRRVHTHKPRITPQTRPGMLTESSSCLLIVVNNKALSVINNFTTKMIIQPLRRSNNPQNFFNLHMSVSRYVLKITERSEILLIFI